MASTDVLYGRCPCGLGKTLTTWILVVPYQVNAHSSSKIAKLGVMFVSGKLFFAQLIFLMCER